MTRCLISIFLLCLSIDTFAQRSDLELLRSADFSDPKYEEPIPGNYSKFARMAEDVKKHGLIGGIVVTTDRITANNRVGSVGRHVITPEQFDTNTTVYPVLKHSSSVSQDAAFVDYLFGNGMNEEAVALLEGTAYDSQSDTLNYLKGWAYYNTKRLTKASEAFSKVPVGSAYYDKSLFFDVVSNAHLGNYDRSMELLESYSGPYTEVAHMEHAGLSLLKGDTAAFATSSAFFTYSDPSLVEAQKNLCTVYNDRLEHKRKSPFLAATASALVPGLGKVYSGHLGEGVSSFMVCGALAAVTAETWHKNGLSDWRTILFGTLSAAFYVGNIYGSYISVELYEDTLTQAQNLAVLYNIHIPLRSVFR